MVITIPFSMMLSNKPITFAYPTCRLNDAAAAVTIYLFNFARRKRKQFDFITYT